MKEIDTDSFLVALTQADTGRRLKAYTALTNVNARDPIVDQPILVGVDGAASILDVSRTTIWRLARSGRLKRIELTPGFFKFRRDDVVKLAKG